MHLPFRASPPQKKDVVPNPGRRYSFSRFMHSTRPGSPSSLDTRFPQIYIISPRLVIHACTLSVLQISFVYYLILLPMLTSRSLHNPSQLSILYPSTLPHPQSQSGAHIPTPPLPTPPNTLPSYSLYSFFFISSFVHLVSILICLPRSRIVMCYARRSTLFMPRFHSL